jgi:hypothetical protein
LEQKPYFGEGYNSFIIDDQNVAVCAKFQLKKVVVLANFP